MPNEMNAQDKIKALTQELQWHHVIVGEMWAALRRIERAGLWSAITPTMMRQVQNARIRYDAGMPDDRNE